MTLLQYRGSLSLNDAAKPAVSQTIEFAGYKSGAIRTGMRLELLPPKTWTWSNLNA
jgi:hypothetical protein